MVVDESGISREDPPRQASRRQMSNTTRYLCAAAYLDHEFRDSVLKESLGDEYRAVAPSLGGFDLGPVIHHCRQAEDRLVIRDALVTAFLLLALLVNFVSTLFWLIFLAPLALLVNRRFTRRPALRTMLWIWVGLAIASPVLYAVFSLFQAVISSLNGSVTTSSTGLGDYSAAALTIRAVLGVVLFPIAPLAVVVWYRVATYTTLATTLRPGAPEPDYQLSDPRVARRLDYLRTAQWGNITMYADEDAFMGAGSVKRVWSISVELDRVREQQSGSGRQEHRSANPVDIDPYDLHGFVRTRLTEMRDRTLRSNESIQRLDIGDHVIAPGTFRAPEWSEDGPAGGHPLTDSATGMPRHRATPEEIAAIVRHPQGGVRYYQRVTIANTGQEIRDSTGALVVPATDQEALTSAFIYLAVEGRMLYTQFVVTVLPPAQEPYRIVDMLPNMSQPAVIGQSLKAFKRELLRDMVAAPARFGRMVVRKAQQNTVAPHPSSFLVYPHGARLSVRELGAGANLRTHIQTLDVAKYTKLIEQRLTEAVLDYLEEKGVDTGSYRLQAASVITNSLTVGEGGTLSGSVSFGAHSTSTVNNARPSS